MQIKHLLLGLLLAIFTVTSYAFPVDNDRKTLLTRKWKATKVIENGEEQKVADYVSTISFAKDGSCKSDNELQGKWHLIGDQSDIVIKYNYDKANDTIHIAKLTATQLILSMVEGNSLTSFYFSPIIPPDFVPESNAQTKLLMKKWKVKQMLIDGKPDQYNKGQVIQLNLNGEFEDETGIAGIWKFTQTNQKLLFRYYHTGATLTSKVKMLQKDLLILTYSMKNQLYKARLIPF